jgi:hypothetical protein
MDERGRVVGYEPNPHAENFNNLPDGYYTEADRRQDQGLDRLAPDGAGGAGGGRLAGVADVQGRDACAHEVLPANPDYEIDVGLDFGRQPAAICAQGINKRVLVLRELPGHNEGAATFAPKVRRFLAQNFPWIIDEGSGSGATRRGRTRRKTTSARPTRFSPRTA